MKKLLAIIFAAFVAVPVPFLRAADPSPVSVITMIGSNPTFNPDGSLATAPVQALFLTTVTVAGAPYTKQESVSWDGTSTAFTVTVDGMTLTPKQVTQAAALIANYVKSNPPPPPQTP
jgi:hypothetical protein